MASIPEKHKERAPSTVNFGVVIVSTSRYLMMKHGRPFEDESGDLIVEAIRKGGHRVVHRTIVPDDEDRIVGALSEAESKGAQSVVFSGGTGVGPRDVTVEAIRPLLTKELPGFGELLRRLSYDKTGSPALLTRSVAGTRRGRVIFIIPGSPDAVKIALENLIVPEAGHILAHLKE